MRKLFSLILLLVVTSLPLAACSGAKAPDLAKPSIQVDAGKVTGASFEGRDVIAVDAPPANLGNAEVWLKEGQIAELVFNFGDADSQVVVTPDPAFTEGLNLGFLDVNTLQYSDTGLSPELENVYARLEPGEVRVYIAAKNFVTTHFWVRLDVPQP